MSGIAGIVNLDGAPVNRLLLQEMTEAMAFRGPDAQEIWSEGPVGFGHAMLRTTHESARERQPCSLEGQVWITADARMDARAELVGKLRSKGRECTEASSDPELILHSYSIWGEECVEHLLGDFAFVIWDGRHQRLFCARDHFGVKPFFYAQVGKCLVFSNTLNCVRMHPAVSDELNDLAIADFLVFGFNEDNATTAFHDIRRVPPAHTLTWSAGALRTFRYWTLPAEGPIFYQRESDYVEHFRELMREAVEDRLRTERVGIFLTGGLDSTTVAATAKEVVSRKEALSEFHGYTIVYRQLMPDQEGYYAELAAKALAIAIHRVVADDYGPFEGWDTDGRLWPEPAFEPQSAMYDVHLGQASTFSRVALTGIGGDPAFSSLLSSHFRNLLQGQQFLRLAADAWRYLISEGRLSRLYISTRLRRWFGTNRWRRLYPPWLNEDFAKRLDLRGRWEKLNGAPPPEHPVRSAAYGALTSATWPCLFEGYDAGATLLPLEVRHPFFDLRLLRYLLALPVVPWCVDKELLRESMRGTLPDAVRLRRKTPLSRDPVTELMKGPHALRIDRFEPVGALANYVQRDQIPSVAGEKDADKVWINLRPFCLNYWLQFLAPVRYKTREEDHEFDAAPIQ